MSNLPPKLEIVKPPGEVAAQVAPSGMEPVISCNRARVVLAQLKGCKKIDHTTLVRLVKKEGLPKHEDPFGTGHWCLLASEIEAWWAAKLAANQPMPIRKPGRPRKVA